MEQTGFCRLVMETTNLTINKSTERARVILVMMFNLLDNRTKPEYGEILTSCTKRIKKKFSISYSCQELDNFFYDLAERVRPDLISEIQK